MSWFTKLFKNRKSEPSHAQNLPSGLFRNAVAIPGDDGPEWIRIVPIGEFPQHPDGAHAVTREHVEQMARNAERFDTDILFDLEHRSLWGESRAVGWAGGVEARQDGLYVRRPEWTPYGEGLIANREYRYLSPVYTLNGVDKSGGYIGARLISVGVTNTPYFDEGEIDAIGNSTPPASNNPSPEEDTVDRKKLAQQLGLAEDAADEQIEAKIAELNKAAEKPADKPEQKPEEKPKEKPANQPGGDSSAEVDVKDLAAKVNSLQQQLADRDRAEQAGRAEALVNSAVQDGKILPAQKAVYVNSAKADFDGTKAMLDAIQPGAALPKGVKVNSQNPAGQGQTRMAGAVSSDALSYVNSQYQPAK